MKVVFLFAFISLSYTLFSQTFQYSDFYHLDSLSTAYIATGNYKAGLPFAKKNVVQCKQTFGQQDTIYAKALDRLGTLYFYLGQYDKVKPIFEEIVSIRESVLGANHPDLAAALSNLSLLYDQQGLYEKAIPLSIRAVEIDKQYFGEMHQNYSISINNLGLLYYNLGDYKKASTYFSASLDIDKKTLGEKHPDYLSSLHNLGLLYQTLGDYKKANLYLKKVVRLRKEVLGLKHPETLRALSGYGNLNSLIGNYDIAVKTLTEAMDLALKTQGPEHHDYAQKVFTVAKLYERMSDFQKAEHYTLMALKIYEKSLGREHRSYMDILSILSQIYLKMYRNNDAEIIARQALDIAKNTLGIESPEYSFALRSLGDVYQSTGKYNKALEFFLEALKIDINRFGKDHHVISTLYLRIAGNYVTLKDDKKAIEYYEKAAVLIKNIFGQTDEKYAFPLNAMAHIYLRQKNFDKAESLLQEALLISENEYGPSSFVLTDVLNDLAYFYNYKGSLELADSFVCRAIITNSKEEISKKFINNDIIDLCQHTTFWNPRFALASIYTRARIKLHFYEKRGDLEALKTSLETFKALAVLATGIQRELISKENQNPTIKYANYAAIGGLKICHDLYVVTKDKTYLEQGIAFAEHNKSTILSASLSNEKALNFGEVPDSLVHLERAIKKRISELNSALMDLEKTQARSKMHDVQEELLQYTLEQEALKKQLSKDYPKYNSLKHEAEAVTEKAIRNNLLDQESALLEYIIYDSLVYLILITPKETEIFPLHRGYHLQEQVRNFRRSLHDYKLIFKKPKEAGALYQVTAHELYKTLLQPAEKQLKGIKKLIIVADGILGHIPFEALLTESVPQGKALDYAQLPYLIQDFSITYSYSAALLLYNKKNAAHRPQNNGQIIGFAAAYPLLDSTLLLHRSLGHQFLRPLLEELPAAQQEVKGLEQFFGKGKFLFGLDANEANFKEHAPNYAVIHLAMHGVLDHGRPLLSSLAFSENLDSLEDNFLEAHEISHLQLNSDLVVLSACETGFGKFKQGEGILSLARSFMYAGGSSLVVSLWQVNDASTADIMTSFYQNLAKGQRKDVALRQAKLDFFQQASGLLAHPVFWSAFIQLGDPQPIYIQRNSSKTWLWGGLLFLVFCIGAFVYRRTKNEAA